MNTLNTCNAVFSVNSTYVKSVFEVNDKIIQNTVDIL